MYKIISKNKAVYIFSINHFTQFYKFFLCIVYTWTVVSAIVLSIGVGLGIFFGLRRGLAGGGMTGSVGPSFVPSTKCTRIADKTSCAMDGSSNFNNFSGVKYNARLLLEYILE